VLSATAGSGCRAPSGETGRSAGLGLAILSLNALIGFTILSLTQLTAMSRRARFRGAGFNY
jgi:hypothetical protein